MAIFQIGSALLTVVSLCLAGFPPGEGAATDGGPVPSVNRKTSIVNHWQPPRIDSKPQLASFDLTLSNRLRQVEHLLQPLKKEANRLRFRLRGFQRERSHGNQAQDQRTQQQLIRGAIQLRSNVEKQLAALKLDELDTQVRFLRGHHFPRALLDRNHRKQVEQSERIYKNIIDLLVKLIECPVNIMNEMAADNDSDIDDSEVSTTDDTVDESENFYYEESTDF